MIMRDCLRRRLTKATGAPRGCLPLLFSVPVAILCGICPRHWLIAPTYGNRFDGAYAVGLLIFLEISLAIARAGAEAA